jgi:hemerythrin
MAFEWRPDLAVGVEEIDAQHRELFVRTNQLLEAMARGEGRYLIGRTLDFLTSYAVDHFGNEERRMALRRYPAAADHKAEHVAFAGTVEGLRQRLEKDGASAALTLSVQRDVCDWLVRHIGGTDRRLGAFLQAK